MSELVLLSPLAGWSAPLEEVPDPVFSGRMLGDGVAIDPLGTTLCAPCAGQIVALPETRHAVTLRTDQGVDVLMHIGVDTVALGGAGFQSHVTAGQRVRPGEALLSFDLDLLARRAASLLTPILVISPVEAHLVQRTVGRPVQLGEVLMQWTLGPGAPTAMPGENDQHALARTVRVALEHGIHARPAAQVAAGLKGLRAEVHISFAGRRADARSATALMALGVRRHAEVQIHARGPDAPDVLETLAALLSRQTPSVAACAVPAAEQVLVTPAAPAAGTVLRGVVASRGFAVGPAARLEQRDIAVVEAGSGIERETAELRRAREEVRTGLERSLGAAAGPAAEILAAHLALLEDPQLEMLALESIGQGRSAAFAWRAAIGASIEALRALGDARMAERADDLADLQRQVLLALAGQSAAGGAPLPPGSILIAEQLLPSQLVGLEAGALGGICLAAGGPTSHVAILAAAAGIPALVALGPAVRVIAPGTTLVLDAETGQLQVDPDEHSLAGARRQIERAAERCERERAAAERECRMADGTRIEVLANLGSLADAELAVRNGAEGCGLLRTEFLFLDRLDAPTEAEQRAEYQRIAAALAGRPLTIRTLDIGGDKPIAYLPLPPEDNPALGLRGIRTSLWREDLLDAQLRAVLAVEPVGQCRLLLPMITDLAEVCAVRARVAEACRRIGRGAAIELGVMVETPASALMADALAGEVDFFSIGTNDLTQYTLAMDRGHPQLAARLDALHPAVLRLIGRTAEAAHAAGRRAAVCGGLASDPAAVPVLIGLGVHELSCVPSVIPRLKMFIGQLTLAQCRELARAALALDSAEAVRALCVAAEETARKPAGADA
ncbi:MAG: phosphoenolpyruvate--protein phosphotransferase [Steroidobacteraceae bacterium]